MAVPQKDRTSRGVSSTVDRARFLERRRKVDAIVIGGNTARCEPYRKTPVPVVVISTSMINSLADNRQAYWWNASPSEAIERAQRLFGPTILVEAGTSIIIELLELGLIDRLELSVSSVTGGDDRVDYKKLLSYFTSVESEIEGRQLFTQQRDDELLSVCCDYSNSKDSTCNTYILNTV